LSHSGKKYREKARGNEPKPLWGEKMGDFSSKIVFFPPFFPNIFYTAKLKKRAFSHENGDF